MWLYIVRFNSYIIQNMENIEQPIEISTKSIPQEQEELITDFSEMFKANGNPKKTSKVQRKTQNVPKWTLEIPQKIQLVKQQLCQRKLFDQRRWDCVVKCSKIQDRIAASVTSVWNYLFSKKGVGQLEALNLAKSIKILKQTETKYQCEDQFQRASVSLKCFQTLCTHFKVQASARTFIKPAPPHSIDFTPQHLYQFQQGLKSANTSYLLITSNNIICPVGFQDTPLVQADCYKKRQDLTKGRTELWILSCSTQRFQPTFMIKRWKHIMENLTTMWPNYTDLQDAKKGVQRRQDATVENQNQDRGCSHCILQFRRT